jgi:hypothetical protein
MVLVEVRKESRIINFIENILKMESHSSCEERNSQDQKKDLEKDYVCGDLACGRRYGTNAALYTHIKNKHRGIPPVQLL